MFKFTKEEKIVLIFLLGCLFIGLAGFYYKKVNPPVGPAIEFNKKKAESLKKININEAGWSDLVELDRIGPVLAERIIDYRAKYGPFEKKESLKNVKGIGDKTYEKIKGRITLE
ncbi:MAG: helix-hairpin-helix domain-containing protein [Omnitrophica bacterium]|nr:helix-hairpin-helix domain-containing protein [Candidatus Omnitrophota bacterium]